MSTFSSGVHYTILWNQQVDQTHKTAQSHTANSHLHASNNNDDDVNVRINRLGCLTCRVLKEQSIWGNVLSVMTK